MVPAGDGTGRLSISRRTDLAWIPITSDDGSSYRTIFDLASAFELLGGAAYGSRARGICLTIDDIEVIDFTAT